MTACRSDGCTDPAAALVAAPQCDQGDPPLFAIVRPITTRYRMGVPLCVDCTHTAVDLMLMRAKEATQ